MTYKQIETSREVRLWIGQIIVPAVSLAVTAMAIPQVREPIVSKVKSVKESFKKRKFKKVES